MVAAPTPAGLSEGAGLTDEEWRYAEDIFRAADVNEKYWVEKLSLLKMCSFEEEKKMVNTPCDLCHN